jgi:hypothetical protein
VNVMRSMPQRIGMLGLIPSALSSHVPSNGFSAGSRNPPLSRASAAETVTKPRAATIRPIPMAT